MTVTSTPHRNEQEEKAQIYKSEPTENIGKDAERCVYVRGRDCPVSLTGARAESRMVWPTTWVHIATACAHASPRVARRCRSDTIDRPQRVLHADVLDKSRD